jgi:hypothetical protein
MRRRESLGELVARATFPRILVRVTPLLPSHASAAFVSFDAQLDSR